MKTNPKVQQESKRREQALNASEQQIHVLSEVELQQIAGGRGRTAGFLMTESQLYALPVHDPGRDGPSF